MAKKHPLEIVGVPTYQEIISGVDEPDEMWITGTTARELCRLKGLLPLDANQNPIRDDELYYLSEATGLIPA